MCIGSRMEILNIDGFLVKIPKLAKNLLLFNNLKENQRKYQTFLVFLSFCLVNPKKNR